MTNETKPAGDAEVEALRRFDAMTTAYIRGAKWSLEMGMSYKLPELYKAAYDYADKTTSEPPAPDAVGAVKVKGLQERVQPWMMACFGAEISSDIIERNHRFLEEALELVQSTGCTVSEAHQLVDYVYGRAIGETHQEIGGVMITLAALCLALGEDMHQAGETELARIWTKVEKIRAKQAAKPKHSPLPAALTAAPAPALGSAGQDVLAERRRQIDAEGWTPEHDDTHTKGELADAAALYASLQVRHLTSAATWPWDLKSFNPTSGAVPGARRRDLVKAGALILAEIERLDRKEASR